MELTLPSARKGRASMGQACSSAASISGRKMKRSSLHTSSSQNVMENW